MFSIFLCLSVSDYVELDQNDSVLTDLGCTSFVSLLNTAYYYHEGSASENLCIQVRGGAVFKGEELQITYYDETNGISNTDSGFAVFFGPTAKNIIKVSPVNPQGIGIYTIYFTLKKGILTYLSNSKSINVNILSKSDGAYFYHFSNNRTADVSISLSNWVVATFNTYEVEDGFHTTASYYSTFITAVCIVSGIGKFAKVRIDTNSEDWVNPFDGYFITDLPQRITESQLKQFGISYWLYIIIFVCCVIIIASLLTIIILCCRKRKVAAENEEEEDRRDIQPNSGLMYLPDRITAAFQPGFPDQDVVVPDETKNEQYIQYPEPIPSPNVEPKNFDDAQPCVNPYQ
ncbi:hypothetical protein TVAG_098840 [Trichomonas vaginalis G3]|uniref:Uncharacterized protein n=1 Tax=Trichomonas vaginalis (strain ATCC PRA-98 / G3) TaxID=412133 RepID=A2EMD5_TRIV3|nr:hypothetical protein TVAGG3_0100030 [Trichomonas vaginalis G3]EAY06173.1 hypothetical protein TVAG_098840 [Trichomonas vaginalis G3]KAI5544322.1 hypothetical protein TVAGG3_0100030 [Trichomonas vaginalis G3]|eukprot:XP_001318396.1 hypothetical protein [Trichomonas vaginalis G3]